MRISKIALRQGRGDKALRSGLTWLWMSSHVVCAVLQTLTAPKRALWLSEPVHCDRDLTRVVPVHERDVVGEEQKSPCSCWA